MTKTQFIEISWSSGSLDEARKISRELVKNRLVASAQIIPWVETIYLWDGQLETTQESRVLMKTSAELFSRVQEEIKKHSKYEIPEITFRHIDGGNQEYMEWLAASCKSDFAVK